MYAFQKRFARIGRSNRSQRTSSCVPWIRSPGLFRPCILEAQSVTLKLWRVWNLMSFSEHDLHKVGAALAFAARTEIMPRFGKLTSIEIRQKSSPIDLVPDGDEVSAGVIRAAM